MISWLDLSIGDGFNLTASWQLKSLSVVTPWFARGNGRRRGGHWATNGCYAVPIRPNIECFAKFADSNYRVRITIRLTFLSHWTRGGLQGPIRFRLCHRRATTVEWPSTSRRCRVRNACWMRHRGNEPKYFNLVAGVDRHARPQWASGSLTSCNSGPMLVGGSDVFVGSLDELEFGDVATNTTRVPADLGGTLDGSETGLVDMWPFDDCPNR